MKQDNLITVLLVTFIISASPLAFAQDSPAESSPAAVPVVVDPGPEDALNRGTPRGSIVGYLAACSVFDFEKAAEFLDLRELPEEVEEIGGKELARQLNHILSRAVWLDDYSVSDKPEGLKGDDLPAYRDELVVINQPDGEKVSLWMQRVPRGDGEQIWKVSNRSVAKIPALYELFSYSPPVEKIRGYFPKEAAFLGVELFKWFIIIIVTLLAWPFLYLLGRLLTVLFTSRESEHYDLIRKVLTGPLVALPLLLIATTILVRLGAGAYAQEVMKAQTLVILFVVWAGWSIINLFRQHKQARLKATGRPGAAKLMRPLTAFLKMVLLILGLLFWLNNIGINITTVLAGLGVGGLAIALALQKPLEDMMGALTIFSQSTVKVGDFCKYGEFSGTVEDIGLRSVKVRTLTNTLVTVPNSRIAYVEVENITAREKIRFWPTLRLRYDTTPEQLKTILDGIRAELEQHELVHDDPIRVRLTDFDEDAILIKINSFLKTTDFPESLEIGEDLNFRILNIIHSAGANFALPGKSVYMETSPETRNQK